MSPPVPTGPFSLFLDVDGTLIDIAPRPDAVVVPTTLLASLQALQLKLDGAIALVSGRTIADLDHLFQPLRLPASGVHGAEMRFGTAPDIDPSMESLIPDSVVEALREVVRCHPGTLLENKRYSVAVHYRAAPSAGAAIDEALTGIIASQPDHRLRILPGHMVFELKGADFDKGAAIRRFMSRPPFAGRLPIFLGDDVTDRPGFDAVMGLGGRAFSVAMSLPGLSGSFVDPSSVRQWLTDLVQGGSAKMG